MERPARVRQYLHILARYALRREHTPFLASFKLTYRCNLTCRQCPFYAMQGSLPELNFAQVLAMLDTLYARGNRLLVFEGGEPLLWRDGRKTLRDVLDAARQRTFAVGVTTNGTLPLDLNADVVWVSVDGFAATHDALRGAPCFARILQNISAAHHPRLYAHITVNRINAAETPALVRYLAGRVRGVTIQFYYPYAGNADDALFLPFPARRALLQQLIELKREGLPILNSAAALRALQTNRWQCADWLVDCANPDGSITQGCYLKGRACQNCALCGFSPHTEISLAWRGSPAAVRAGMRIFGM